MEANQMKKTPMTLAFAILLLAVTPVLAQTAVEPSAPVDTPPVAPNDAYAAPPMVVVPVPDDCKNTGASNPCTPDPTRNTPGAEAKQ
jgi:hypothetical protein